MKILVISLLRLGDLIMASPTLRGLRQKYPNAEIHVLANKGAHSVAPLMPYVDQMIDFEREELQHGLVQPNRPIFESLDRFKNLVKRLNNNKYDLTINLTQNKLSGYLMGFIDSEFKMGLTIDERGQTQFHSSWFKHLNDVIEAGAYNKFHFSDVFYYGSSLERSKQLYELVETTKGQDELLAFIKKCGFGSDPKVVIQPLTSDNKKNWGIDHWVKMIQVFKAFEPQCQVIILGAPNEANELQALMTQLKGVGVEANLAILSLEGAFSLLCVSDLLITGDTSIKHLAAAADISIIELSLGSSHFQKTGAYAVDSVILASTQKCTPCDHRKPCHRDAHYCSFDFTPELVAALATKRLHNDWMAIQTLAVEYEDSIRLYRTQILTSGVWYAKRISKYALSENVENYVNIVAWQFYLESDYLKPLASYGSESQILKQQFMTSELLEESESIKKLLNDFEMTAMKCESKMSKLIRNFSQSLSYSASAQNQLFFSGPIKDEIVEIENELHLGQFLSEKLKSTQDASFYNMRQLQASLNTAYIHQQIKIKLLRSLKSIIKETQ